MRTILISWILAIAVLLPGCGGSVGASPVAQQGADFDQLRRVVQRWLECTECWDGELNDVLALGEQAYSVLDGVLTGGLNDKRKAVVSEHLEEAYDKLENYLGRRPQLASPFVQREDYRQVELDRHDLLYRSRAARALAAFGTEEAQGILDRALDSLASRPNDDALRSLIESF